ncbi:hypothetical protein P692DRAFT_20747824, partial [Suillus brevipes Sb2]
LTLYYHLKSQPCYTKPHSDPQRSASSLGIVFAASTLMSTSIVTYAAACIRVKAQWLACRVKHSTCNSSAASLPRQCLVTAASKLIHAASLPRQTSASALQLLV